jgi:N-acyl homoserine lactone hydrolase
VKRAGSGLAAVLLAAALSVNPGHAQSEKPGVEKLYILNCGEGVAGDISRWSPGVNEGKSMDFVDTCYLIKHAQGWFLWDTGLSDAVAAMPNGLAPSDPRAVYWHRPKTLAAELDQLGVKPADIKAMAISHTHPDHIGNVEMFPTSMLYVQKAEYEWPGANNEPRFKPAHPVTKLEGDHDVFGDGSVTILSTPGHTPGHQSLLVKTAAYRRARSVRRCRSFQKQLGQPRGSLQQLQQGADAGLHAKDIRHACQGKSPALDQPRQGAARRPEDVARVLRLRRSALPADWSRPLRGRRSGPSARCRDFQCLLQDSHGA